jgi:hypothetical protein
VSNIRTADQVAELYGVAKSTVHRWVKNGGFDPAPTVVPSPSGERDRILFDVDAVVAQYEREFPTMGDAARLEAFRRG